MRLKGEDVSDALRDWVKSDLKDSGKTAYDLGKFVFTVSSSSIGILATLQKLDPKFHSTWSSWVPYVPFALSLVLSLVLVLPRKRSIPGDTDLYSLYAKDVNRVVRRFWAWFALWSAGVLATLWSLFIPWTQ